MKDVVARALIYSPLCYYAGYNIETNRAIKNGHAKDFVHADMLGKSKRK